MTLNPFQFNTTPSIRFGSGQAKDSCKEIFHKLGPRILFVTDRGLMSLGLTKPTIDQLNKIGAVKVFDQQ
jgi:alcohol dehydrogenase class IV